MAFGLKQTSSSPRHLMRCLASTSTCLRAARQPTSTGISISSIPSRPYSILSSTGPSRRPVQLHTPSLYTAIAAAALAATERSRYRVVEQVRWMKVRSSVKKLCDGCKVGCSPCPVVGRLCEHIECSAYMECSRQKLFCLRLVDHENYRANVYLLTLRAEREAERIRLHHLLQESKAQATTGLMGGGGGGGGVVEVYIVDARWTSCRSQSIAVGVASDVSPSSLVLDTRCGLRNWIELQNS